MKLKILCLVAATIALSGCAATKKPMYLYGDYSESFYALKREAGDETSGKWKSSLESIISDSNKQAMRVPPGVYANLGFIHLKANDNDKAVEYFELEKKIYPEAEIFMNNLIKKANAQG
ncbi:DUF4810 domain-containing protein [Shewanella sp.]|uniref:DUF4810 domain-containing protein n=1 Tax=Shewanella sp. TaxID=50422 RepID=UPI00405498FE